MRRRSGIRHESLKTCIFCCCCLAHLYPVASGSTNTNTTSIEETLYRSTASRLFREAVVSPIDVPTIVDAVDSRSVHKSTNNGTRSPCEVYDARDLLNLTGVRLDAPLSPKQLTSLSVPIIAQAVWLHDSCNGSARRMPCQQMRGDDFISCWTDYLLKGEGLQEEELITLIQKLGFGSSSHATIEKFYQLLGLDDGSVVRKAQIPLLTSYLVTQLLADAYPSPESFLQDLFDVQEDDKIFMSDQRLAEIAAKLQIANVKNDTSHEDHGHDHDHDHDHGHEDHDEHDHHDEHKHGVSSNSVGQRKRRSPLAESPSNATCWSLEALKEAFHVHDSHLSPEQFQRLCPALIQQSFSGACEAKHVDSVPVDAPTTAQVYGYGTLSVFIISLLSVLGIVFLPMMRKAIYFHALQGFIALGVGVLCGDALLHLLPEGFGVHNHGAHTHEGHDHEEEEAEDMTHLWRALACLGGKKRPRREITLHAYIHKKGKRAHGHHHHNHDGEAHDHSHIPDPSEFTVKTVDNDTVKNPDAKEKKTVENAKPRDELFGATPLAWMMLLGDSLHNFGDGLTLAAAFTQSMNTGLSTSIAIFCHEVPHELGDFAILLGTGMRFWKAMLWNFISALACLAGFYIGVPIAKNEEARQWILVVAAGMFLYVALADMLPELKNGKKDKLTIFLQNLGILVGGGIMVLMGIFEDEIKV